MLNKIVLILSFVFLTIAPAYAALPEQPNSVPLDPNSLQTLIDNANKGDANAQYNLGWCYNSGKGVPQDCNEAVKWWKKAADQGHLEAYLGLGTAYGKLGRWQEGAEAYKQAIKIKADYAEAYLGLGTAYGNLGHWQEAIEAYKQAIRIKQDYAEAHYGLGAAYSNLGRWQEALESCNHAIQIKPDYAEAYHNLSSAYGNLGRWQEATESCKHAIQIRPDYAGAHYNLGLVYLHVGDKDSALEEYKILKTLDVEKANKLFNLINK
jgi:tetratricopeptide (TPR) repeat protein